MDIKDDLKRACLWALIPTILFATCRKDACIGKSYAFRQTWQMVPASDSIAVGDTIVFSSEIPTELFDYNTNDDVDFSGGAEINSALGIYVLPPGTTTLGSAVDSFKFIPIIGRVESDLSLSPDHIKQIFFDESGDYYRISFQMIALKKGIYTLGLADGIARRINRECEDRAGILFQNANANNHIYYLQQFYGSPLPSGENEHGYCFKVK